MSSVLFTPIDWNDPLEVVIVIAASCFILVSVFANRLQISFLHRGGGFLTYSKFATNVKFGVDISSKFGMAFLYWPSVLVALYFLVS